MKEAWYGRHDTILFSMRREMHGRAHHMHTEMPIHTIRWHTHRHSVWRWNSIKNASLSEQCGISFIFIITISPLHTYIHYIRQSSHEFIPGIPATRTIHLSSVIKWSTMRFFVFALTRWLSPYHIGKFPRYALCVSWNGVVVVNLTYEPY